MKKLKWHKLAESVADIKFQQNNLCVIEIEGKQITLSKHNNQLHACAYKCPHAGGILADGFIDALGNIVCPLHRYKFNPQNGRNTSGEGYYLKTWQIETREDGIFIGLEESSWG